MSRFQKLKNHCVLILLFIASIHPGFTHGPSEDRLHNLSHEIAQQPDNPVLYLRRGIVLDDSKRWNEALSDYQKAFEIDSDYNEALFRQGKTHLQKGNLKKSIAILQRYLKHLPHSPAGHKILAKAYANTNRLEKAVHHYDLSVKYDLNPSPQIYLDRMHVLLRIKPLPADQIASGLMEGIRKHGKTIIFSDAMIKLHIQTKKYEQAINWIEKLPESLKNSPYWLNSRAALEHKSGDLSEALRLYTKSILQFNALPISRQNTSALASAHQLAQQEILNIKAQVQAKK